MLEKVRPHQNTFVVELEVESLKLVAALLHDFVATSEDGANKLQARLSLQHLTDQTECVSMEASRHRLKKSGAFIIPEEDEQALWLAELTIVGNNAGFFDY